jgi:uncharacterized protein (TIGR02145 family)
MLLNGYAPNYPGTWRGVYSGNFNPGNGLNNQSTNGYYWSATANSATNGYNLNFSTSTVNPANNTNKYNGFAVRCITTS